MLPFSREQQRLPDLKASLAVYRLVFGQPRQEDLLSHLKERNPDELSAWRLDMAPPVLPVRVESPDLPEEDSNGAKLLCRLCGAEVGDLCTLAAGEKNTQLLRQAGDRVMLYYHAAKNGGPEYCPCEVLVVNGDCGEVEFSDSIRNLRFRGGNHFWDVEAKEHCRLVSHVDPSGADEIAWVCPTCGQHRHHRCRVGADGSTLLTFSAGALITVTYSPVPG